MDSKKLIIAGAGDVGKYIAYNVDSIIGDYEIAFFLDDNAAKINTVVAGYEVKGPLSDLNLYSGKGFHLAIGIAFPSVKQMVIERYQHLEFSYPPLISKHSWLSNSVKIGQGSIIYPGVSINYEGIIGDFVVINMNCALGHNATIGNYSALAPGVNFGGFTTVGNTVDMGIGSTTIQKVTIGDNAVIGGQTMLIKDVPPGSRVVGVPGRSIHQTKN
jgi:sugar O-acyltransferase (sialic acid O-acetyltransferase NeuD family)